MQNNPEASLFLSRTKYAREVEMGNFENCFGFLRFCLWDARKFFHDGKNSIVICWWLFLPFLFCFKSFTDFGSLISFSRTNYSNDWLLLKFISHSNNVKVVKMHFRQIQRFRILYGISFKEVKNVRGELYQKKKTKTIGKVSILLK